ncbi:uncharacterized protein LOC107852244 isoform X2 [Capsicum annuum]|uniref:uncharacterized protein LOC107852244 isoform X2 n=1 Tax=Capsicum annuum TaxID=4072 RepID=UPI0007BFB9F7|nr:uncharacterized protein LOC107852244 isoform X2 [Capsicum annuum]
MSFPCQADIYIYVQTSIAGTQLFLRLLILPLSNFFIFALNFLAKSDALDFFAILPSIGETSGTSTAKSTPPYETTLTKVMSYATNECTTFSSLIVSRKEANVVRPIYVFERGETSGTLTDKCIPAYEPALAEGHAKCKKTLRNNTQLCSDYVILKKVPDLTLLQESLSQEVKLRTFKHFKLYG